MATRFAINGFGRIGRMILRAFFVQEVDGLEPVAVNDITAPETLAHLFRYDSNYGGYPGTVEAGADRLIIDGREVQSLKEPDPAKLPWGDLGVEIVFEATGRFREREAAAKHLKAGAQRVIITAPAKGEDVTLLMGVNHERYDPDSHRVVSNASCTTNCVAPVAKVLDEAFRIEEALMTTIHSYTNDQSLLDGPHKDLRRARAAGLSIIPTTTGAARATGLVLTHLDGRIDGLAMRVPTPTVSVVDLVASVKSEVDVGVVNQAFRVAAGGELDGILGYSEEPLVSVDFKADPRSAIVDGLSTMVVGGRLVKVLVWYDNEWAYSLRCLELARYMAERAGVAA